ncbi:MAG: hypothetical protein ABL958_20620 [Bdellovibrionia bacterium]
MKKLKMFTALAIALVGFNANAEVKPPGTFVPTLCSPANDPVTGPRPMIVAAKSVCFGRRVGLQTNDLKVELNDGSARLYKVIGSEQLPTTMEKQVVAARLALVFVGTIDRGTLSTPPRVAMAPIYLYAEYGLGGKLIKKLQGTIHGNVKINASKFAMVFTTLSTNPTLR